MGSLIAAQLRRTLSTPRRLTMRGVPFPVAVVSWIGVLLTGIVSLLLVAGYAGPDRALPAFYVNLGLQPLDYRPLVLAVAVFAGGAALGCLGLSATSSRPARRLVGSVLVMVGYAAVLTPTLVLDHHRLVIYTLLLVVAASGLVSWPLGRSGGWLLQAALLLLPGVVMLFLVLGTPGGRPRSVEYYLHFSSFWGTQFTLAAGAVALVSTLIFLRFGGGLATKHQRVVPYLRREVPLALLGLVVAVKVGYLVLRYAGVGGDWLGDADLWRSRSGWTWVHAAVVAVVIVGVVLRSERNPCPESGRQAAYLATTSPVVLVSLCGFVLALGSAMVSGLASDVGRQVLRFDGWVIDRSTTIELILVLVVCAGAACSLVASRQLVAGHLLVAFTAVWVIPFLIGFVAVEHHWGWPTYWADSEQVDTAITGVVVAVLLLQLTGRRPVAAAALMRLLIVPALLVNLASAVPGDWTGLVWRVSLVVATILPIIWASPPVAADPARRLRTVTTLVGTQIGLLVCAYVAIEGYPNAQRGFATSGTLALYWIAVPVAALLCVRMRAAEVSETPHLRPPRWARIKPVRPLP